MAKARTVSTAIQRCTNPQLVERLRMLADQITSESGGPPKPQFDSAIDEVEARLCPKPPRREP